MLMCSFGWGGLLSLRKNVQSEADIQQRNQQRGDDNRDGRNCGDRWIDGVLDVVEKLDRYRVERCGGVENAEFDIDPGRDKGEYRATDHPAANLRQYHQKECGEGARAQVA
ncbi:hypothetical protein D3C81_1628590 [compost metagenome]